MDNRTLFTSDVAQTEAVGAALAQEILSDPSLPHFVALYGDLGVGKTAFVRGFSSVVAPGRVVKSPTFSLVNEYRASPLSLFHFDLYRIEDEEDLISIGYDDYLARPGICLTEWSEKIPYAIPEDVIAVTIEKTSPEAPDSRRITLERKCKA